MTETCRKLTKIFWMNYPRVSRNQGICRFTIDRFPDEQWLFEYDGFGALLRHGITGVSNETDLLNTTSRINRTLPYHVE